MSRAGESNTALLGVIYGSRRLYEHGDIQRHRRQVSGFIVFQEALDCPPIELGTGLMPANHHCPTFNQIVLLPIS
jgi:hypothetical protein